MIAFISDDILCHVEVAGRKVKVTCFQAQLLAGVMSTAPPVAYNIEDSQQH